MGRTRARRRRLVDPRHLSSGEIMMVIQSEADWQAIVAAIQSGDVDTLKHLLTENPALAATQVAPPSGTCDTHYSNPRSLLHIATDWPGNFPNGAETVRTLIRAGADVNVRFKQPDGETALHWAASSDDVEVLDALLDHGADIEARGAVIGGGTALADAVAFGQWRAARRLIERGAIANLWQAAALGLLDAVERLSASEAGSDPKEITPAFWCACHGGQRETAEYLLDRGADINWIGFDRLTALDAALRSEAAELAAWLRSRGAQSAADLGRA